MKPQLNDIENAIDTLVGLRLELQDKLGREKYNVLMAALVDVRNLLGIKR